MFFAYIRSLGNGVIGSIFTFNNYEAVHLFTPLFEYRECHNESKLSEKNRIKKHYKFQIFGNILKSRKKERRLV